MEVPVYPFVVPAEDRPELTFHIEKKAKQGKRGPMERWIMMKMLCCGVHFLKNNMVVTIDGHRYEPDLVYVDESQGIYIDIEIDEPYTWHKHPCHYLKEDGVSVDANRDRNFSKAGWTVARFSERQFFLQTGSCVGKIVSLIGGNPEKKPKFSPGCPDIENRWTWEQSVQMASSNFRASYLGFTPGDVDLKDIASFAGKEFSRIFSGKWMK